jgi:hypothetical protein
MESAYRAAVSVERMRNALHASQAESRRAGAPRVRAAAGAG